jgi:hypothetical protein
VMELLVGPDGAVRCIYGEELDLGELGEVQISRASFVEPDEQGRWWAEMAPVVGPKLGPFDRRSDALAAEGEWLRTWLFGESIAPRV